MSLSISSGSPVVYVLIMVFSEVGWQPGSFASNCHEHCRKLAQGCFHVNPLDPHLGSLRERRRQSLEHHHPAADFTREGLSRGNLLSIQFDSISVSALRQRCATAMVL